MEVIGRGDRCGVGDGCERERDLGSIRVRVLTEPLMPDLGTFSLSLTVKDIAVSKAFYEKFGFHVIHGEQAQGWLILQSGEAKIGLFQGMFETNIITFNPTDVRAIQRHLSQQGIEVELLHAMDGTEDPAQAALSEDESGPAHLTLTDPDGNVLLFDQF